ncbi:hypothetical protein FACS1894162_5090 [Bacteroidia bacterium]|nr:hypothetical protein FACS1894162_5090 [Bacteroidia bacterium]
MKMKKIKQYAGLGALVLLAMMSSCKEDTIVDNPAGETVIYALNITNGDMSGAARYVGAVDEASKTITFDNVAIESDLGHLKFAGTLSLGAHLNQESYDFRPATTTERTVTGPIVIDNVTNHAGYTVVVNLLEPTGEPPFVNSIEVQTASGAVVKGTVVISDVVGKVVYLNVPSEDAVTIKSLVPAPAWATSNIEAGALLSKATPTTIDLDFMGVTSSFDVVFGKAPIVGVDISNAQVFNFSGGNGGTIYPGFEAIATRSADFDANYVLLTATDGTAKVLSVSSILSGSTTPTTTALDVSSLSGGTYKTSAGRLAQGHIYICNLTTAISTDPLKVYHWASPSAAPTEVFSFDGVIGGTPLPAPRFGDNMSVNLDASGNGYIYFFPGQEGKAMLRVTVTNFTTVSDPIDLTAQLSISPTYYPGCNQVGDANEYLLKSPTSSLVLMTKEGVELLNMITLPQRATDPRVFIFNGARYLLTGTVNWGTTAKLLLYDISEGVSTIAALNNFEQAENHDAIYSFELGGVNGNTAPGNSNWAEIGDDLYCFTAAARGGFVIVKFPKNQ